MTAIARPEWKSFSEGFSRDHDGWSASLELRRIDGGVEVAVDDRPFRGITSEKHDGHEALILTFGDDPDEHLAHIVDDPSELALLEPEEGHCSLVIGASDGTGCVVEMENPFNPD